MSVESVAKYIVAQRLANNEEFFCVLQHIIQGHSPSTIKEICNVTKNSIRSYIQRIIEKTGSSTRALIVAKHILPLVIQYVPTAVVKNNGKAVCMLCHNEISDLPQYHMIFKHTDTVNYYALLVVSKLREMILVHG